MTPAARLTSKLFEDGIISSEEVDIVSYGLETVGSSLMGLLVTLAVGMLFGQLLNSFIFWLLVMPLRKNAGGFHAKTKTRCLIISTGILIAAFGIFFRLNWEEWICISTTLVSGLIIFFMAPIGNQNKSLDSVEHKVYRKRTRYILAVEGVLFMLAVCFEWKDLQMVITSCFAVVAVSLLAEMIRFQE